MNLAEAPPRFEASPKTPFSLRKELNVVDATAIVVGTVIGSGIFLLPSLIAAQIDSLGAVLLVWIAGGLLTVFGGLSLAELGSIYPGTGGLCTYLRHIYGPLPAFLYAWALLAMIHSGSIAALSVAFGFVFRAALAPEQCGNETVQRHYDFGPHCRQLPGNPRWKALPKLHGSSKTQRRRRLNSSSPCERVASDPPY
jgi:amino acid transporter